MVAWTGSTGIAVGQWLAVAGADPWFVRLSDRIDVALVQSTAAFSPDGGYVAIEGHLDESAGTLEGVLS